jgi:hypothetical protein
LKSFKIFGGFSKYFSGKSADRQPAGCFFHLQQRCKLSELLFDLLKTLLRSSRTHLKNVFWPNIFVGA